MGPGITIFILFFGVVLLDAVRGGRWGQALFWVAVGLLFFVIERKGVFPPRPRKPAKRSPSSTGV